MQAPNSLKGFHAHIYFDADEVEAAKSFAEEASKRFKLAIGRFHLGPIGPHPRGSCQLSMKPEVFAQFTLWALDARGELTIFCHGLSGDAMLDHTQLVLWMGQSETIDLTALD